MKYSRFVVSTSSCHKIKPRGNGRGNNLKGMEKGKHNNSNKEVKKVARLGRPPLFDTPEQMQEKIDEYFAEKVGLVQIGVAKDGTPINQMKAPTISGLNYYLGFCDRTALDEYAKKPNFSTTVKRAKLKIQQFAEQQLFESSKPTGAIFWLKNNGWKAEEQVEVTGSISSFSVNSFLEKFNAKK